MTDPADAQLEGPAAGGDPAGPGEVPGSAPPSPPRRLEDVVGRVSVLARRLARPLGLAGRIGLVAGAGVWLLLPSPVWPDRPPWWSSVVSLVVLVSPGTWLVFHRWWLDRVFVRAAELAPAATATALATYGRVRSGRAEQHPDAGRGRRAWRFYRGTVAPLHGHVSDALGITLPLRPVALITSGVALLLTLVLLLCIPVALVVRVVLLMT